MRSLAGTLTAAVLLVGSLAVGSLAVVLPASAAPPSSVSAHLATAPVVQKVQRVKVSWRGSAKKRTYSQRAVIPGIGQVALVCRPDQTLVKLIANDPTAETQMWMAKYQTKNGERTVATKTARIYRYANADDTGKGGTGRTASEGLNELTRIENYSSGYMDGVISQRAGRQRSGSALATRPVTSFTLDWWWTGFRHPADWRQCKISATFRTRFDTRMGISWHGNDDTAPESRSWPAPGLGTLGLTCSRRDPESVDADDQQTVTLTTADPDAHVWVEYVTGEGTIDDHIEAFQLDRDDETGQVGPLDVPRNGMMRLYYTVGSVTRSYILSSYWVTNNTLKPQLNLCEMALAVY